MSWGSKWWEIVLIASLEVNLFVCVAVITGSSVNEDAAHIASVRTMHRLARKSVRLNGAVNGRGLSNRHRHLHVVYRGQVLTDAMKTRKVCVRVCG